MAKCYENFMAVINEFPLKARVFVPGKPFQLSLMFWSKAGAFPRAKCETYVAVIYDVS
jgi:hypothetical protein